MPSTCDVACARWSLLTFEPELFAFSFVGGRGSKISGIVKVFFIFTTPLCCFAVGDSKPNGQEDISPYATFHLLGMREEAKNNGMVANAANFQTMPHGPQQPAQQQVNNPSMAPTTPRHMSQTMNVSLFVLIFFFSIERNPSK